MLFFVLRGDVYDNLPADLQKLVDDSADYYIENVVRIYGEEDDKTRQICRDAGCDIVPISDQMKAEWEAAAAGVYPNWIETMNGKATTARRSSTRPRSSLRNTIRCTHKHLF